MSVQMYYFHVFCLPKCLMSYFVFAVDVISAIEFNKTGDYLATGDRGGRVVLFERTDNWDVSVYLYACMCFTFLQSHFTIISCLL